MLEITLGYTSKQWYVGKPSPVVHYEVESVTEIEADGEELQYIKDQYTASLIGGSSMPIPYNKLSARWFGDLAKTIVANL